MASIVSQTIVVIVKTVLSERSVDWPRVRRRNLPVTKTKGYGMRAGSGKYSKRNKWYVLEISTGQSSAE